MSFSLRSSDKITIEETLERVKALNDKERERLDKERYTADPFGQPLGVKKALIWIDVEDDYRRVYNSEDPVHMAVLERLDNRFRDDTTRKLAVEVIRQANEKDKKDI